MSVLWLTAVGVLIVIGLGPALVLASRGTALARLVGLQFAGVVAVMALLAMAMADSQSSYLIVPLVLAILLVTGTLVFTRLIRQRGQRIDDEHGAEHDGDDRADDRADPPADERTDRRADDRADESDAHTEHGPGTAGRHR